MLEPTTLRVPVAGVVGAIGLAVWLWLAWRRLPARATAPPAQLVLLTLAGFVAGTCLLTGMGRLRLGLEFAMASRYATPVLAFWISIVLLLAARVRSDGKSLAFVMAVSLPLALLMAASEGKNVQIGTLWASQRAAATPALLADLPDNRLLTFLYPDPSKPLRKSIALREARSSVFVDAWAGWLGTPLSDHVTATDNTQCQGTFDRSMLLTDAPALQSWRAVGQVWTRANAAPLERLVLVDSIGRVVGYGIGGLDLAALGIAGSPAHATATGWVGAYKQDNPASVTAYALVSPGPAACRLGSPTVVGPRGLVVSDSHPAGLSTFGFVDLVGFAANSVRLDGWGLLAARRSRPPADRYQPPGRGRASRKRRPAGRSVGGA